MRRMLKCLELVLTRYPKAQFQDKSVEQDMNGLIKGDVELSSRRERSVNVSVLDI